jgi:hypothetical protein
MPGRVKTTKLRGSVCIMRNTSANVGFLGKRMTLVMREFFMGGSFVVKRKRGRGGSCVTGMAPRTVPDGSYIFL